MKRLILSGASFGLLFAGMAFARQEQGVNAKNVPAPVTAAVMAFPNAKVGGWSKETEPDGKVFYEAEMTEGKIKRDVLFALDGKIDVVEEAIAATEVPAAVRAALKARYPKAAISLAEKLTRTSGTQYELQVKNAPKKEIVFTPDGKLVSEE